MIEDELTGLHNRRSFLALLKRHVLMAVEREALLAVVVIDIDDFARINTTHGYEFGDAALRHVAGELRQLIRPQDYAARLGNDRFALILTRLMNKGHAELAVQKLFRQLEPTFTFAGNTVRLRATAGAAVCPSHASHADFLLRQAEKALAIARETGQPWLFPAGDGAPASGLSEWWDLEIEMQGAIERGEMFLRYQPKLATDTLRPVGAEALMRWQHRSRGLVPPDRFIPIAEQTGQIRPITVWALNSALRQAADWPIETTPLSVAVNVPAEMVAREDLPELVENALRLWGRPNTRLTLEITERSLIADPARSFRILSQVREQGVKVSIDDFGTGYSCLAYFKDIPADELKIDKSFVAGLLDDPACADIAALIIDLAHRFGLTVVAEGVEDEATLAALRARGCDTVQGHLFAEALPQDTFRAWLRDRAPAA
ncbi:putative bifunctional diguanylate cyclase/phosphodiesterase [Lysobacter olei]